MNSGSGSISQQCPSYVNVYAPNHDPSWATTMSDTHVLALLFEAYNVIQDPFLPIYIYMYE